MVKQELNARSPLRILERSTHGGLGKGNLGALAARKGVGKTAFLVHLATDQLLRGKHVIHVSFAASTAHIVEWYQEIFRALAARHGLKEAMGQLEELVRRRIIMNFNQRGVRLAQVIGSIRSMIRDGHFNADCVVVDGYDLAGSSAGELREVRRFAAQQGLEVWFSASLGEKQPPCGMPTLLGGVIQEISVLLCLRPAGSHIRVELVKDHDAEPPADPHLELDPRTLLIAEG